MTKRFLSIVSVLFVALCVMAEGRAKYVFYFIGDGMGVNQVNTAETYLGAVDGRIGIKELCFPSFPYSAYVTTSSATNVVTDSSAGGVALASGHKTKNGAVGVLKDLVTPVTCIADWAHASGAAVGIATSVTVDHATPAAFYAHVAHRSQTYEIGEQLTKSEFDFFAGSDFTSPKNPTEGGPDLYKQAQDNGFTIARGYKDYQKKARKAQKMILLQSEEASREERSCIPYAIDRYVRETGRLASDSLGMMRRMLTGHASVKNISGPITIARVANASAERGVDWFLYFLALLSLSLCIINLLPIPILDGGHLLYYLIELVKGSPLSERAMAAGQYVGLALLAGLMGLAFYNDILGLVPR